MDMNNMNYNPHYKLIDACGNIFPVCIDEIEYTSVEDCERFSGHVLNVRDHIECHRACLNSMEIKNVIYNNPATIVFWCDGTKTVVKCQEGYEFDPMAGLAMAICEKAFGSKANSHKVFNKWLPKEEKVCRNTCQDFTIELPTCDEMLDALQKSFEQYYLDWNTELEEN